MAAKATRDRARVSVVVIFHSSSLKGPAIAPDDDQDDYGRLNMTSFGRRTGGA
jgi:hypothetical protein